MIVTPNLEVVPQTPTPPRVIPTSTVRKFSNFLTAFEKYGDDSFTPPSFNTWTGVSIIAGALERKVWIEWNQSLRYYPNLYVMLVALPGMGKTTAINRGIEILKELYKENRRVNFLPTQVTEAKLVELMGQKAEFRHQGRSLFHCSSYYFASEASDSFKEIYGDITSTMTNFYDCPDFWEKATKKDGRMTIENACLNLIAGSTLQYLSVLVNEGNIMGGFASRVNYVISRESKVRETDYPIDLQDVSELKEAYKADLVEDLKRINEMVGPFTATLEFRNAWKSWDIAMQKRRAAAESEKMQSLLVRQGTSMHKLSMVFSAAESSDRVLRLSHFEQARDLLAETEKQLPGIFREARSGSIGQSGVAADGLKNAIFHLLSTENLSRSELTRKLYLRSFETGRVEQALTEFIKSSILEISPDGKFKLLIDPDKYL